MNDERYLLTQFAQVEHLNTWEILWGDCDKVKMIPEKKIAIVFCHDQMNCNYGSEVKKV